VPPWIEIRDLACSHFACASEGVANDGHCGCEDLDSAWIPSSCNNRLSNALRVFPQGFEG
jgi:hypothetical protein